ncbi:hypothetical protein Dimus_019841 [Dionaea muscipula]
MHAGVRRTASSSSSCCLSSKFEAHLILFSSSFSPHFFPFLIMLLSMKDSLCFYSPPPPNSITNNIFYDLISFPISLTCIRIKSFDFWNSDCLYSDYILDSAQKQSKIKNKGRRYIWIFDFGWS